MGQKLITKIVLCCLAMAILTSVHGEEEVKQEKKEENQSSSITGLGIRKLIGSSIKGIFNTTTTTTPKPGLINQARNFFKDTKKQAMIVLDPRKALENKIKEVITG